jgi:predicted N-formylglutamate amidohydrolase
MAYCGARMTAAPLLGPDEPSAVAVFNEHASSPFVLVCDHAGRALPRLLGNLGLSDDELSTHIAWDIGIGGLGELLAAELDATLFRQHYSRLVIDCNRPLEARDSIPEVTCGVPVPGNQGLTSSEKEARIDAIFRPYHAEIRSHIEGRSPGRPCVLLALHSFTPILHGDERPFHAGVLYNDDQRFARPLLEALRAEIGLVVGDNEPYRASVTSDYSIIEHAEKRGLLYVEIEVRQDLITHPSGQEQWARRLARCVSTVSKRLLP